MTITLSPLFVRPLSASGAPPLTRGPAARTLGALALALGLGHTATAQSILGSTAGYGAMAGGTVTINGTGTTVTGNLGAIGAIAGPGSNYTVTSGAVVTPSAQHQTDFTKAFNGLAAMTPTATLSGSILGTTAGATTLTPGIYKFDSTAQLTGTLTLDAQGASQAVWVFQIGSTFTTAAGSSVVFSNLAANSAAHDGVFWQVGTATVFGATTALKGNVLGGTTYSFGSGATISEGRALTGSGTMTFDGANSFNFVAANSGYSGGLVFDGNNVVASAIPEPATTTLLVAGFFGLIVGARQLRQRQAGQRLAASA
jgi:hypothetical protein